MGTQKLKMNLWAQIALRESFRPWQEERRTDGWQS
jgi:hypothetical protein